MRTQYLFGTLFCLNLLNYIDRQALYSLFPLLQIDLQLTDLQLGALASCFMLVYMCYAPLVGYLADRSSRTRLIGLSALLWSGATLACGAACNYISLFIPRALIGVGEGGFTTIAQPFLAEHYPAKKHASVLALFGLALPVGSALGYMLGGLIGHHWGWRIAFMAVGIPGVFLGLLAWLGLKDVARETQSPKLRPTLKDYFPLFKNKPFLSVCFAQAMSTFVMGGLAAWMPMYLHRYLGWDTAQAGTRFGGLVIICGAVGTLLGGKLAARWIEKSSTAYYKLISIAFLAALPFCWLTLCATHEALVLLGLAAALTLLFIPTGAIAAALVATTSENIRSMAFALNIFIIHLLGDAISPTLVGWISDGWSLKAAVFCCTLMLLPGIWASSRTAHSI
ncbi:MAG: MFS transporter [Elusimicrobiaceae bacterium]|nr:MFS transporter [Elusimicrobiaceae bacterium]